MSVLVCLEHLPADTQDQLNIKITYETFPDLSY